MFVVELPFSNASGTFRFAGLGVEVVEGEGAVAAAAAEFGGLVAPFGVPFGTGPATPMLILVGVAADGMLNGAEPSDDSRAVAAACEACGSGWVGIRDWGGIWPGIPPGPAVIDTEIPFGL